MSFGGILATALAGGAQVVGKQAGDDIEAGRKTDLMREQAAIEEAMRMRLAEFSEKQRRSGVLWDNTGEAADAKLSMRGKELAQQAEADIAKARGMIPVSTEAARAMIPVTQEAARAKADTDKAITKEQAADPIYLGAVAKIKLADPEVAARIAASRASAGASAASAAESRERTEGLRLNNADKKTLDKLYGEAGTILADASISDEERAKQYGRVQTQIVLMKSKNGQVKERDPELDTPTVTEEKLNPDGTTTKTTRKEVRKAGNGSAAAPGAPEVGTEVGGYVFKGGDPNDKKNWTPKAAAKQASGPSMLKTQPLDMQDITFAGDGYKVNGQTYPTLEEARKARDAAKARSNSPMTQSMSRYGDD